MKKAFVDGIILDGTKNMEPQENRVILVEDGKIIAIVDKEEKETYQGCEIIDLKGAYIMPGLVNLHVHLAGSGKPKKKPLDPVKAVKQITSSGLMRAVGQAMVANFAKTQLMSGTTTIRTVGGIADFDTKIRDEINAGKRIGPRIIASGMAISVPEGHMAGSLAYVAHNAEEARHYVDVIAKDKPDLIKLMITGGVMDAEVVGEPGVLRMPPECVKAACDRAHELGLKVAAHVESPKGVEVALENGVDSIEHGAKPNAHITELFKETGAFQVATLCPALPYGLFDCEVSHATKEQKANGKVVFDGIIEMAKDNIAHGVPVGLGTDTACPFVTQYDMWRELDFYGKYCEVSNAFALYTGTLLNAILAGVGDVTGSIEVGKCADMIVTKRNPLDNLSVLRHVQMVVKDGVVYGHPQVKKIPEVEAEMDKFNRVK